MASSGCAGGRVIPIGCNIPVGCLHTSRKQTQHPYPSCYVWLHFHCTSPEHNHRTPSALDSDFSTLTRPKFAYLARSNENSTKISLFDDFWSVWGPKMSLLSPKIPPSASPMDLHGSDGYHKFRVLGFGIPNFSWFCYFLCSTLLKRDNLRSRNRMCPSRLPRRPFVASICDRNGFPARGWPPTQGRRHRSNPGVAADSYYSTPQPIQRPS